MLHYATLITLQLQQLLLLLLPQLQQQVQLHRTTLHCTNYTAAHYTYKYKCDYNYITLHYTALHYTNYITLRYNYNCNYNCNYHYIAVHDSTLIALRYTTTTTTLPYTTLR